MNFIKSRFYIVAKNIKEVREAKKDNLCQFIILEDNNIIHIWKKCCIDWKYDKYVAFDKDRYRDVETTGLKAYQSFYNYCGKNEVDRMKNVLSPISLIESEEQMHFCNVDYIGEKIYSDIYVFDANSSFTFGVFQLQKEFDIMKEYYSILYDNKKNATNKIIRAKFKNLQNYLIGYFARVSGFISVRSNIIENSNNNIKEKMSKIINNGGVVYLSNTDSIVTDEKGKEVMIDFIGDKAGDFKLEKNAVDYVISRQTYIN